MTKLLSLGCLSVLLVSFPSFAQMSACGLSGTVDERIADCKKVNGDLATQVVIQDEEESAQKAVWTLVTKTESESETFNESWKDEASGIVWTPTQMEKLGYEAARDLCHKQELWVPSAKQFMKADEHGVREIMKNLHGGIFWTFTRSNDEEAAFFYNGTKGYVDQGNLDAEHDVLCTINTKLKK